MRQLVLGGPKPTWYSIENSDHPSKKAGRVAEFVPNSPEWPGKSGLKKDEKKACTRPQDAYYDGRLEEVYSETAVLFKTTMKTMGARRFVIGLLATALVGIVTLIPAPANAAHEMIYAVDTANNLFNFWSDDPGNVISQYAISGIQNAEEIRGLDYYSGVLYGLGSFSHLYTINPADGVAAMVGGAFLPILNGATFGVDNDANGFRVLSNLRQNLLVNRATGTATAGPQLSYAAGDVYAGQSPRADALAYDPAAGSYYVADTLKNSLASFNPATGVLSTIGAMGIDPAGINGMDISPFTGIMYMGTGASSSDPQANLYIVNRTTGFSTLVGQIDVPGANTLVRGLTVVPEPGSFLLLALGALGLVFAHRRQQ